MSAPKFNLRRIFTFLVGLVTGASLVFAGVALTESVSASTADTGGSCNGKARAEDGPPIRGAHRVKVEFRDGDKVVTAPSVQSLQGMTNRIKSGTCTTQDLDFIKKNPSVVRLLPAPGKPEVTVTHGYKADGKADAVECGHWFRTTWTIWDFSGLDIIYRWNVEAGFCLDPVTHKFVSWSYRTDYLTDANAYVEFREMTANDTWGVNTPVGNSLKGRHMAMCPIHIGCLENDNLTIQQHMRWDVTYWHSDAHRS